MRRGKTVAAASQADRSELRAGMFVLAGTANADVRRLNSDIGRIMDTPPRMEERMVNDPGGDFTPNTPDQLSQFLAMDRGRWQQVIRQDGRATRLT
jgi:hypothetical protein